MKGVVYPGSPARGHRSRIRTIVGCATAAALMVSLLSVSAVAAPKPPSVKVADIVVSESAGTASFTIKASPRPGACCPLSVDWATADGTATQPADFAAASGTVTLTRSASTAIVTMPIAADALDEPNETFVVNLSNLVGTPGQIGDAQAVGTITDDDLPPALSIDDVVVGEG
ncbi:MAG TPA: Calx-beta domain-containing protein, partial [Actinomycetota bacterium]|nr:Calx-beta domain-containing protein [Actinomycetota bacterium]